jgi:hypothetical protein
VAGKRFVQIGHVSGVMFAVMDLHRFGVDVRLERVKWIRRRWQLERPLGRGRLGA